MDVKPVDDTAHSPQPHENWAWRSRNERYILFKGIIERDWIRWNPLDCFYMDFRGNNIGRDFEVAKRNIERRHGVPEPLSHVDAAPPVEAPAAVSPEGVDIEW